MYLIQILFCEFIKVYFAVYSRNRIRFISKKNKTISYFNTFIQLMGQRKYLSSNKYYCKTFVSYKLKGFFSGNFHTHPKMVVRVGSVCLIL